MLPADVIGGAEIQVLYLLTNLRAFRLVLLTQAQIADTYKALDIPLYYFDDYACHHPYCYAAGNVLAYARAIKQVVKRTRPDIIFGLMHNGTVFVTLAKLLLRVQGRVIGSVFGHLTGYFKAVGRPPSLYERLLMRLCFACLDGLITNSRGVRVDLVEHYGALPERTHAVYNGFDLTAIQTKAQASLSLEKDCPWLVTACRLGQEKDFDTLLKAFSLIRQHHRIKLVIVGDGPRRQEIVAKGMQLGIAEDMILPGFQHNPFPWIAQAEIFVLSSFYEGFGNVIVEAMALGVPVIACDCPCGPGEIIRDGESGFLLPVGDAEAMAERCTLLLEDALLRQTIAANGLLRSGDFALEKMTRAYEDYFNAMTH